MNRARVVRFHRTGGPEVLGIETLDIAPPGPGEALVAVGAIGLNRAEAAFRRGRYLETPRLPARLGFEACGVVEAVGDGAIDALGEPVSVGDRVCVLPMFSMNDHGVYAERAAVPAASLIGWPPGLNREYAAALWMAHLTAWGGLVDVAAIAPGDAVVITAASSSVGLAAIQIAAMIGAIPIAATRDPAKAEALSRAGAAHVVVTGEAELGPAVMDITGDGARVIFDPIGGPTAAAAAVGLAPGGQMILYGDLSGQAAETPFPFHLAVKRGLSLRGYLVFEVLRDHARLARARAGVLYGLNSGALRPIIDRTFAFDDIVTAHRHLESNQQIGKVVIRVGD